MSSFNFIAPVYGFLKLLVFGRRLNKAEEYRFDDLSNVQTVLIFGGGAGKLLEHSFFATVPIRVMFLEASGKMLDMARKRAIGLGLDNVEFVEGTHLSLDIASYDLILCPFVLDVFTDAELPQVLNILKSRLNESGQLIVTDFTKGVAASNQWLVPFMYFFFRLAGALNVKNIAAIESGLRSHFRIKDKKYFCNQKVASWLCTKD
jgi:ubiquinone/menaquinone biosynthesis C-methylase UbiE